MIASNTLERRSAAPEEPTRRQGTLHLGDFCIPIGFLLWAVGLSRTVVPDVQPYGLMTSLPIIYYAGIAIVVVSAVLELRHTSMSEWRLAAHAVALAVMLFATAPVVYPEGRYAWLYKTIGVVQYINVHGQLNAQIDIYQNWPGFFALAAWFDKVAGVASPLAYAKWAQPVFELAAIPLLYLIYDALALPVRQRWVAIFLYTASNWIGQDYFSPQALGSLLSLGIMALALRWLYTAWPPADARRHSRTSRRRFDLRLRRMPRDGLPWWSFPKGHDWRWSALICGTIVGIFFVLSMTHQLSPYMAVFQLGALAAAKMLRPRWLPAVLGAVAVGYLAPRFSFVNSHFGLLSSLGALFNNVKPPSLSITPATASSETTIAHCCELLSVGMWCLALAGAWLRRKSRLPAFALVLLAFSPILLLGLGSYGNEGVLRVFLFSLPYTAALGAMALVPARASVAIGPGRDRRRKRLANRGAGTLPVLAALVVVLALFFPSFFGNDNYNVMPASEVTALTSFQQNAVPGVIYAAIGNGPFLDTGNYNLIDVTNVFGSYGAAGKGPIKSNVGANILNTVLRQTSRSEPVYIVIAPSMVAYDRAYSVVPVSAFAVLERSLANTPPWQLVLRQGGTEVFELPPNTLPVVSSSSPSVSGKQKNPALGPARVRR
jgi:hypothetical protein